jgi:hypothetical protein
MGATELHAQASLWLGRAGRTAVLLMEGQARDRSGDGMIIDALHQVALARGLRLTTDLGRRDPRPTPGWRVHVDHDRTVTVEWPGVRPLLDRAPLELPAGWLRAAVGAGRITLIVGYGLALRAAAHGRRLSARLESAARDGQIATGLLPLTCATSPDAIEIPAPRTTTILRADSAAADVKPDQARRHVVRLHR